MIQDKIETEFNKLVYANNQLCSFCFSRVRATKVIDYPSETKRYSSCLDCYEDYYNGKTKPSIENSKYVKQSFYDSLKKSDFTKFEYTNIMKASKILVGTKPNNMIKGYAILRIKRVLDRK